jgi:hypothetical protein
MMRIYTLRFLVALRAESKPTPQTSLKRLQTKYKL